MPKLSKATAPHSEENPVLVSHHGPVGDYTVVFETYRADADGTPFFRGLPDDRCQSPHWGYVISGRLTLKFADRDEIYTAGTAFYAPPGHIPVIAAGTEVIEFSPTVEYEKTMKVAAQNLAAMTSA